MKKWRKIAIYVVLVLFVLVGSLLGYVKWALPNVGEPEELKVEITPTRLERGRYLANHVTLCVDCHSTRDWSRFAGPYVETTLGAGGEMFDEQIGFPGKVQSPNITPFNLKGWTDGELFRLITTGVTRDNKAIINIMPYTAYGKMDREDIYAVIAYIRSLSPKSSIYPEHQLNFPLNFLVNTIPQKAEFQKLPDASDTLKYGGYLVNAAACVDCHTKHENGSSVKGLEFSGGRAFDSPFGILYSANITPDKQTGIGRWTRNQFISKFKAYSPPYAAPAVGAGDFQTIMPWTRYSGLKESDLAAMYVFLQSVKPIKSQVVRFVPKKTKQLSVR
jgi:mono/diheme cytochrome c family protein